jgi:hypothetical protein
MIDHSFSQIENNRRNDREMVALNDAIDEYEDFIRPIYYIDHFLHRVLKLLKGKEYY